MTTEWFHIFNTKYDISFKHLYCFIVELTVVVWILFFLIMPAQKHMYWCTILYLKCSRTLNYFSAFDRIWVDVLENVFFDYPLMINGLDHFLNLNLMWLPKTIFSIYIRSVKNTLQKLFLCRSCIFINLTCKFIWKFFFSLQRRNGKKTYVIFFCTYMKINFLCWSKLPYFWEIPQ